MAWLQSDFAIPLKGVKFKHVMNFETIVSHDQLSEILGTEIHPLEYHKFKKCITPALHMIEKIPDLPHQGSLIEWAGSSKGCKKFRTLMKYENPMTENFTCYKYWTKHIPDLDPTLLKQCFSFISKAPFTSHETCKNLKIKWNITGTNHIRAKYVPTVQDRCKFCEIEIEGMP